jgi:hypothetical protein
MRAGRCRGPLNSDFWEKFQKCTNFKNILHFELIAQICFDLHPQWQLFLDFFNTTFILSATIIFFNFLTQPSLCFSKIALVGLQNSRRFFLVEAQDDMQLFYLESSKNVPQILN